VERLGELLVDVHGQSEHMALLRAREQLDYLDHFAAALPARGQVQRLVRELRATREARQALQSQEREAARTADMLRHEIGEIVAANLAPDEESELLAQRERLQHVERLRHAAQTAYAALSGTDEADADAPGAVDLLGRAVAACQDGARFDPALGTESDALNVVLAQAEESARTLRDYLDNLEADPSELERITERLFLVGDLKRKYGASIHDVLTYAEDAARRLHELEHRAERLDELATDEHRLLGGLADAACALSGMRHTAARRLSHAVEREFADLRLAGARFEVALTSLDDSQGVPVNGRTLAFDASGIDHVEFLLAASGSGEPRPLSKVASGGELARVALALKTILARAETRPTLIFDEIDVGVGGRTAPVVGEKLWTVAAAGRQVLCVTHMPQVAAFADNHYVVSRKDTGTTVTLLKADERVDELAAMIAGTATRASRQSARELLERAR
jgi:DNA repair protein RecN (Recombination protein N)